MLKKLLPQTQLGNTRGANLIELPKPASDDPPPERDSNPLVASYTRFYSIKPAFELIYRINLALDDLGAQIKTKDTFQLKADLTGEDCTRTRLQVEVFRDPQRPNLIACEFNRLKVSILVADLL